MEKINWVQKLSSRKFWAMLIACIAAVAATFGLSEGSIEQITSIIGAFATLIVYILVEGNVDVHRADESGEVAEGELLPATQTTEYEYGEMGEVIKVSTVTTFDEPACDE